MASTEDYLSLITSYHRPRPKFGGTVEALVAPLADLQSLLAAIPSAFDLDAAEGVQLDAVGLWVGRSRYVSIPLANLFFAFDDAPRGFDRGAWKGPYDTGSGITRLDDETYRLLLRAKIAANTWDGTVPGARKALADLFPVSSGSLVYIEDRGDGSMVFGIAGQVPSLLTLALFSAGYIPLKPEGIKTYYQVTSVNAEPVFGFDVQNQYIGGFDTGSWSVDPSYFVNNLPG